jgi:hypothetical protein
MISLNPGQVSSPTTPALIFISQTVGQAVPAFSLSFRILDIHTPELEATPAVIFGPHAVDLVNDIIQVNTSSGFVPGLDQMNPLAGFYVADWTVPMDLPVGKYQIEWAYLLTNPVSSTVSYVNTENPPSGVVRKTFEVVAAGSVQSNLALSAYNSPQPLYSLVTDARAFLGCDPRDVSDVSLKKLIMKASAFVERVTGRYFEPRYTTQRLGGNSSRKLQIGPPIVTVSSVGIDTEPTQSGDLVVELDLLRIYNRHLAQGLLDPDDRDNPFLEFVHSDDLYGIRFIPFRGISLRSLAWPIGVQNIHVRGFFGFTDPDGSPWGETPEEIQHVTRLICAREVHKVGSDKREDAQWRWRVTSDKTRDAQIDMVDPRKWGEYFGDPEIDMILSSYLRPPRIGGV